MDSRTPLISGLLLVAIGLSLAFYNVHWMQERQHFADHGVTATALVMKTPSRDGHVESAPYLALRVKDEADADGNLCVAKKALHSSRLP